MFGGLTKLAVRRSWLVVICALVFAVAAGYFGGSVSEVLSSDRRDFDPPGSQSSSARQRLADAAGANPGADVVALVRVAGEEGVESSAGREEVLSVAQRIADDLGVGRISTAYDAAADPAMISSDGASTYVVGSFKPDADGDAAATRLEEEFAGDPDVTLGGGAVFGREVVQAIDEDLVWAEILAFPILLVLSFWIFRGLVAALLPVLVGGLAVLGSFLGLRLVAEVAPASVFALNTVTGLGLGLAIDYSLLILSRYREEISRIGPGAQALRTTLTTAGRSVLFSSLTVAVALSSLFLLPARFYRSVALGGSMVALLAAAAALVVLPALLALLGNNVNALSLPGRPAMACPLTTGRWYRLAKAVTRRPILAALASSALLMAAGLPFLAAHFTSIDASVLPETAGARKVADTLDAEFPRGSVPPVHLAVDVPVGDEEAQDKLSSYAAALEEFPSVTAVSPPAMLDGSGTTWQIDVLPSAPTSSQETRKLVRDIRAAAEAPYPVKVGGWAAIFVDQQESLASGLPLVVAWVFVCTFLLLFLMTGSVVVPLKAFAMNLLTVFATFGVLVFVFQDGRLEGLLAYKTQGALDTTQPVIIMVLAFALSTDYGVFLLCRIKEARDSGGLTDPEAVATGVGRTGGIVTAAALLFCVAVGAFATSQLVSVKEMGLGTALAVLIDATIVRALLVPSLMKLLGRRNWWAPAPLRRLRERVGFLSEDGPTGDSEGASSEAPTILGGEALRDLAAAAVRLALALESSEAGEVIGRKQREDLATTAHHAWASLARTAGEELGIHPSELLWPANRYPDSQERNPR